MHDFPPVAGRNNFFHALVQISSWSYICKYDINVGLQNTKLDYLCVKFVCQPV